MTLARVAARALGFGWLVLLGYACAHTPAPAPELPALPGASSAEALRYREDVEPAEDTLTLIAGYTGSYPNFAFDVPVAQIEAFAGSLQAVEPPVDFTGLVDRWGVRRSSARFWQTFDGFNQGILVSSGMRGEESSDGA